MVTLEGVPIDLIITAARGRLVLELDEQGGEAPPEAVSFRVDDSPWAPLDRVGRRWRRILSTADLAQGEHRIEVLAAWATGQRRCVEGRFRIRGAAT